MAELSVTRLRFEIAPFAKQRPRYTFNYKTTYTPKETREYEAKLKLLAKIGYKANPLDCPVHLKIWFYIQRPKTVKAALPAKKPDIDNYIKAALDAFNGVLWWDDNQIVDLIAKKRYGTPGVVVEFGEAEDELTSFTESPGCK